MNNRTERLRHLLADPGLVVLPGCHDAISARIMERAGFPVAFMSGLAVSAARLGAPDTGLISFAEMLDQGRDICAAVSIPVIGDGDTGYGNALNVKRTVAGYARAGFAAVMIEDQSLPKRCGFARGVEVVEREEAVSRIRAAVDNPRRRGGYPRPRTEGCSHHPGARGRTVAGRGLSGRRLRHRLRGRGGERGGPREGGAGDRAAEDVRHRRRGARAEAERGDAGTGSGSSSCCGRPPSSTSRCAPWRRRARRCARAATPDRIVSWPHLNRVAGLDDYYAEEERYRTPGSKPGPGS